MEFYNEKLISGI